MLKKTLILCLFTLTGGFSAGILYERQNISSAVFNDSVIGTAGHTKTYAIIAHRLQKQEVNNALTLSESMMRAGVALMGPANRDLPTNVMEHVHEALEEIQTYRAAYPAVTPDRKFDKRVDTFLKATLAK